MLLFEGGIAMISIVIMQEVIMILLLLLIILLLIISAITQTSLDLVQNIVPGLVHNNTSTNRISFYEMKGSGGASKVMRQSPHFVFFFCCNY